MTVNMEEKLKSAPLYFPVADPSIPRDSSSANLIQKRNNWSRPIEFILSCLRYKNKFFNSPHKNTQFVKFCIICKKLQCPQLGKKLICMQKFGICNYRENIAFFQGIKFSILKHKF